MDWVIIDLETTGLSAQRDKIIEIGAVRLCENGERKTFQSLIDPGVSLTENIENITGINDDMLSGQPYIEEVVQDLLDFTADAVPVAHNASFDGAFLEPYLGIHKEEWLDTIILCKMAFPMLESYSLVNLTEYFNISVKGHHRALADALATAELFLFIQKSFETMDKGILASWEHLLADRYPVYIQFLNLFLPDTEHEKYLPPKIAYSKDSEKKSDTDELPEKYIIDKKELLHYFTSQEGLAKHISGYRQRESQTKMALAVCDAFNNEDFLLAEAGTGTGKTVAYLMPAVLMSLHGHQPVVISTHTIHLQDQIMRKDIPELNTCFGGRIKAALIKGRNHYLCYRKWEHEYDFGDHEEAFFLARLLPWVCETEDGDGDGLNLNGFERRLWQRYSASSENCLGVRCRYYHSRCFVRRARKEAEKANLIVINHSLLLTDSVMSGGILPQCNYLIIDEAHQLEAVAESCLGESMTFFDHTTMIADLLSVLQKLYRRLTFPDLFVNDYGKEKLRERQAFLEDFMEELRTNSEKGKDCFFALKEAMEYYAAQRYNASRTFRIENSVRNSSFWTEAQYGLENLQLWYEEIYRRMEKTESTFETEFENDGFEKEKIQFSVVKDTLQCCRSALESFLGGEEKNHVAWLEDAGERALYPMLRTAPLLIDRALADALYQYKESIIFVSATLSVNGKFQYFRNTCGLDLIEKEIREMLLPSPFDYEHNSVLLAATDVPLVGTVSEYEYLERIADAIVSMTTASKGRALILFTSHMHLREVFRRIEHPLQEKGITALAHEISGNRSSLLKHMREDSRTVILGANSFWEGIDVAGENLSLLIIVRLPFWPPDIPTIAAKTDRLKAEKRNSFGELSLPQAIIRFKQGFGRLLRKEDDRGVICVLDKRIYEKRYGNDFVGSLPVAKLYRGTVKDISKLLANKL